MDKIRVAVSDDVMRRRAVGGVAVVPDVVRVVLIRTEDSAETGK